MLAYVCIIYEYARAGESFKIFDPACALVLYSAAGCDPAKDFGCEWESGSGASGDGALFTELDNAANGGDAADLEEQLSPAAP